MVSILTTKTNKNHKRTQGSFWKWQIMFNSFTVVRVSWVYAYVQIHQDVHIKCMQFFVYQLYLNET